LRWFGLADFPATAEAVSEYGAQLSVEYRDGDDHALWRLLCTYTGLDELRLDKLLPSTLVDRFVNAPGGHAMNWRSARHAEIVDLLKAGLPEAPVHMGALLGVTNEAIYTIAHFPRLLLGIRWYDKNTLDCLYKAETVLEGEGATEAWKECSLRYLGLGLTRRKIDGERMLLACIASVDKGLGYLREDPSPSECGYCTKACSKPRLRVELYRCLGAAERKLAKSDKTVDRMSRAREAFAKGAEYLGPDVDQEIRADYSFSHGYLLFESAVLTPGALSYRNSLEEARGEFAKAAEAKPSWAAPLLRIGIINVLLADTSLGRDEFAHAEEYATRETNADAWLTGLLSSLALLAVTDPDAGDCDRALQRVRGLFLDRLIPRGPRECHAFDAGVFYEAVRDRVIPGPLETAFRLLIASGGWAPYKTLDEQRDRLASTTATDVN
jgi:hypothetical protein